MSDNDLICPRYHRAVELIGARWSGAILQTVLDGRHRYSEINHAIPGVSDTMLAQRLRWLQAEGVLERRVLDSAPVHVEYHLTEKGAALAPVITALQVWAHEWLALEAVEDDDSVPMGTGSASS